MPSGHLSRQLRFVLPGAATTYWLHTPSLLARIWADAAPLARFVDFYFRDFDHSPHSVSDPWLASQLSRVS